MTQYEQKAEEKECLLRTFPTNRFSIVHVQDKPDFIVKTDQSTEFGVEVTEFFSTESFARLQKVEGYAQNIIESNSYINPMDEIIMSVSDIEIEQPDGSFVKHDTGVISVHPSVKEQVLLLNSLIKEKNIKGEKYSPPAGSCVLLICDSGLLNSIPHHIEDFLTTLSRLQAVQETDFLDIIVSWFSSEGNFEYSLLKNKWFNPQEDTPGL